MNTPEEETKPQKRHYIPVLPQPRPDTIASAVKNTRRATRNRRIGEKLDAVLGAVDAED